MRVAIAHHHLQTGGVTRVIEHAVAGLRAAGVDVVVISGHAPAAPGAIPAPVRVVAGLAYDGARPSLSPGELRAALEREARAALGAAPDLWHFHNHALGKSQVLPGAVRQLAEDGRHLLLQLHDFAEDGRPHNYRELLAGLGGGDVGRLSRVLYPRAGHVHFAVLNGRDAGFLAAAGVPPEALHLLPNAVSLGDLGPTSPPPPSAARLWLYPTRAIRRKNLGELLLWSALGPEGDRFGATRGPENPRERPAYEHWVGLARTLRLPLEFGLGETHPGPYADLLASAHALVTTSVAEGFGLAYLEPWLVGRPVAGRDLPEITGEFRALGLALPGLYPRVEVPVEWLGRARLAQRARAAIARIAEAYRREPPADAEARVLEAWIAGQRVDFGRLDEPLQEQVIRRVAESPWARCEVRPRRLEAGEAAAHIPSNREVLREAFGVEVYGRRLRRAYEALLATVPGPVEALAGEVLLDQFLAPERLFLLRS